jgi:hypothetical protein
VNIATGEFFTYASPTRGAHIAYEALKEAVITIRALRCTRVMPVVNLAERPMKTKFGMKRRPHFEIIGWKTPGDDAKAGPDQAATPQLAGPAVAAKETPPASTAAASPATTSPTSNPVESYEAKPKPPVNLARETLTAMGDVKPMTMSEVLDDEIPW